MFSIVISLQEKMEVDKKDSMLEELTCGICLRILYNPIGTQCGMFECLYEKIVTN